MSIVDSVKKSINENGESDQWRDKSMEEERFANLISGAISSALNESRVIDNETHAKHHAFIDKFVLREERKQATIDGVKRQVFGWGIITFLSGIGIAVYKAIESWVHH